MDGSVVLLLDEIELLDQSGLHGLVNSYKLFIKNVLSTLMTYLC